MAEQGWTQIPNYLLDSMAIMHRSTFAVAICIARKTVGWSDGNGGRKEWDRISLSQFQDATGLSRQGVLDAIADGVARGWIDQNHDSKQSFEYRLTGKIGTAVEREKTTTGQVSRPVKPVDQSSNLTSASQVSRPELVNSVDTQKKERKEKKIHAPATSDSEGEKAVTTHQEYFGAVCIIVGMDYKLLTKEQTGQVAQVVGKLQKAGYTIDDLRAFYRMWRDDWRAQNGQRPTLKQLLAEIGKLKVGELDSGIAPSGTNGSGSGWAMPLFTGSEK